MSRKRAKRRRGTTDEAHDRAMQPTYAHLRAGISLTGREHRSEMSAPSVASISAAISKTGARNRLEASKDAESRGWL